MEQTRDYQVHFLRYLLDGKDEILEEEAGFRRKQLGLNRLAFPCFVMCIAPDYSAIPLEKKDKTIFDVFDYISHSLKKKGIVFYSLLSSRNFVEVLICQKKDTVPDKTLIDLCERIQAVFGIRMFVGVGSEVSAYKDISVSSSEAESMLSYKFQYADRGVIDIDNIIHFRHNLSYGNDEVVNRVIGCFQDGNLTKLATRIDELVHDIRYRENVSGTSIKRTMIELTVHILHIASDANVDVEKALDGEDPYRWIMMQENTGDITEWFLNLAAALRAEMRSERESSEKKTIQDTCAFVRNNLCDPSLGLQKISDEIGLSASYLSQLFKEEMGLGINSYITRERIDRARELLRETSLKCEDIALQLGFTRSNYFGTVFKKETGYTPSEYRRKGE